MSKRLRFFIVIILGVFAGLAIYPTVRWYFLLDNSTKEIVTRPRSDIRDEARDQADGILGELKEIARSSPDSPLPEESLFIEELARENYKQDKQSPPPEWTVENVLSSFVSEEESFSAIQRNIFNNYERQKKSQSQIIQLGLDLFGGVRAVLQADTDSLRERLGHDPSTQEMNEAMEIALEVLRSRIDVFGVTEPQITQQGDDTIIVEIPGENDPERVKSLISGKGSLNLHLVDDDALQLLLEDQIRDPGWDPEIDGAPDYILAGTKLAEYITRDEYGVEQRERWIAIYEDVQEQGLEGDYITEAQIGNDPFTGAPTVNFVLNQEGAEKFSALTRNNINRSLAIVMDGKVRAYARINSEIPDGQGQISGFSQEEAQNIALVLRTAALPVQLKVLSQQSVGASLGATAVTIGLRAILAGLLLVVLFMLIYYKGSGIIASFMLILNLFFFMAVLSAFNLTLTLTSVAGIVLIVGMSVDANVIIFERIKEEIRSGKNPRAAVDAGFHKAFWTIVDSNVTTFIAALFLSQFGTGPIQGFAVTLAVGIVTSMFSVLFVSRLMYDFGVETLKWSRLSMGWKKT